LTQLLEVGRVAKPHGVRGEVIVELVTDRLERLAPGSVLDTDRGDLLVVASRPHQHRWIVQFEGLADRNEAERLNGLVLRAEPIEDEGAMWVHELIGAEVVERDGTTRGRVVAVVANPAHDLLELESGALVPMVFVVSNDDGVVLIDPPDGLFG
jgi:16S rRNA processing protein RimM